MRVGHPAALDAAADARPARSRQGLALCLSGGGFRAALFHLGALRRLHELGALSAVDTLTGVSGGSIVAAWLASCVRERFGAAGWRAGDAFADWEAEVAAPFRAFAAGDLRTAPVLAGFLLPWNWVRPDVRVRGLASGLERRLLGLRLADLPVRPRTVVLATDLVFGASWQFERERMGDWRAGYAPPPLDWPLARAVAASCCFPPVFAPLRLGLPARSLRGGDYRGPDAPALRERIELSDGGVYDNLGLEPVWKDHARILVSDGGGRLDFGWTRDPVRRLARYGAVVQSQAVALRRRWLMASFASGVLDGVYWGVGSAVARFGIDGAGYSKGFALDAIATIRTDLDGFTPAEAAVLENHGYLLADAGLRRHAPELVPADPPPARPPHPEWLDEARAAVALRDAAKRFSVRRVLDRSRRQKGDRSEPP